jgi:DNA invertase Pin-like site-specific DNA recombinase
MYKGRKPTAKAKSADVLALASQGLSVAKIASQVGISGSSVHRIIQSSKKQKSPIDTLTPLE